MRRDPVIRAAGRDAGGTSPVFDSERLWQKLARTAVVAGEAVVERVLWLWYAAQRPDVPRWAKLTIYGALAYFVMPLDAIPDFLPGAGYVDDMGALGTALLTVAAYVDEDVKQKARAKLAEWFSRLPRPGS